MCLAGWRLLLMKPRFEVQTDIIREGEIVSAPPSMVGIPDLDEALTPLLCFHAQVPSRCVFILRVVSLCTTCSVHMNAETQLKDLAAHNLW